MPPPSPPSLLRAQLQIHVCVLLWGFTAILGRLIALPAVRLVWWRMITVCALLFCLPPMWRALRRLPPRLALRYAAIGVAVALHWLSFYAAIKLANASVAVSCIALAPMFLALIEPWIARRRVDPRELLLGAAVVPGVALVVGGIPRGMHAGLAVGVASALFAAVFGALNKRYAGRADPLLVTALELGSGALFVTLIAPLLLDGGLPALLALPGARELLLLALLALACTLLPFALSLVALRRLSAFSAQLAVNLEPVYAIVLAALLLGEQRELGGAFYAGVALILGAVFVHPWLVHRAALAVAEAKNLDG